MYRTSVLFGGFLILIIFASCQTKKIQSLPESLNEIILSDNSNLLFLDSVDASTAIIKDDSDNFFDRVTKAEMAIQMKKNLECEQKKDCIDAYKSYLQSDVESFTQEEFERIAEVFLEIKEMIAAVNIKIFDRDIILIKTKANHYGQGVYYTRENKIIIPQDALSNYDKSIFKDVMLHEVFHVFSRYNKETRDKLYELIGFSPLNGRLILPSDLSKRKLLNPDGTTDYVIKIGNNLAYPMLTSSSETFLESKPLFFSYLEFKLYTLLPGEDGVYHVGKDIPFQNAANFFSQIKDNTDYIIHPDEIMADNFVYAINYLFNQKKVKDFSSQGMELITSVGDILKAHQ